MNRNEKAMLITIILLIVLNFITGLIAYNCNINKEQFIRETESRLTSLEIAMEKAYNK